MRKNDPQAIPLTNMPDQSRPVVDLNLLFGMEQRKITILVRINIGQEALLLILAKMR
jgi:hypothetical protein